LKIYFENLSGVYKTGISAKVNKNRKQATYYRLRELLINIKHWLYSLGKIIKIGKESLKIVFII